MPKFFRYSQNSKYKQFLQCVLWSFEPCEKQTKVAKLTNEFTHVTRLSCSCLLRHFNFEREKSAPKLPPLYLVLGIATANATCAEDEDSSFSGNKENCSNNPQIAILKPFDFTQSNSPARNFAAFVKHFQEWP